MLQPVGKNDVPDWVIKAYPRDSYMRQQRQIVYEFFGPDGEVLRDPHKPMPIVSGKAE